MIVTRPTRCRDRAEPIAILVDGAAFDTVAIVEIALDTHEVVDEDVPK